MMYTSSVSVTSQSVSVKKTSVTYTQTTQEPEEGVKTADQDTYTPSEPSAKKESAGIYKMDTDTVNQMKAELQEVKLRFLETVKKSLGIQISYGQGAWKGLTEDMEIPPELQASAKDAISEDGYWGVKKTSERLVTFAKALVGGDPSRVEEMRDAFIKGYEAATKAWGSALPDISKQTYDAVMKLFDEWAGISADDKKGDGAAEDAPATQPGVSGGVVKSETVEVEIVESTFTMTETYTREEDEEKSGDQAGVRGKVGINAGKLARMLAAAKTRSQVSAVIAKIQSDLKECNTGKAQGMDVDEASVKAAQQLLQSANAQMGSADNREATPEEEMASSLAGLM